MKRSRIERRTPMPRPAKPMARAPMRHRRRIAAEQSAKFEREYGGPERHAFVESLPCIVPGCPRPSRNAHVVKDDQKGMGRKAGYRTIAPVCDFHHTDETHGLHKLGPRTFEALHHLDLAACARRTERLWQSHQQDVA